MRSAFHKGLMEGDKKTASALHVKSNRKVADRAYRCATLLVVVETCRRHVKDQIIVIHSAKVYVLLTTDV